MTDERPSDNRCGPVVIGHTVSQLASGGWVASAVVLADPAGEGPSRQVVAQGATRDEAQIALERQISAVVRQLAPDTGPYAG